MGKTLSKGGGFPSFVHKKVNLLTFDAAKPYVVFRHRHFGLIALNLTERSVTHWRTVSVSAFAAKLDTLRSWFGEAIRIDANETLQEVTNHSDCYIGGLFLKQAILGNARVKITARSS